MSKHILVTASEQRSALFSIRFLQRFFANKAHVWITLFADAPKVEPRPGHEREETTASIRNVLHNAREDLVRAGFPEEMIDTKTHLQQLSKAMDIIREGERREYDAVALGKRTIARLEDLLERSTTKEALEKGTRVPVWFCRPPGETSTGVLLCVDGSRASYHMADHVGRMLQLEPSQRITLFRTTQKPGPGEGDPLENGRNILRSRGIPQENILTKTAVSSHPGRSIAEKAEGEGYAVVAVGRTGRGSGGFRELFLGSTSRYLFRELTSSTLWVCR